MAENSSRSTVWYAGSMGMTHPHHRAFLSQSSLTACRVRCDGSQVDEHADVVVVGAALGGLVAGAILARHGRRVIVLEETDQVGGRGGAVERDGWWLSFGHRDGRDAGDCQVPWHHGAAAAREAGVTIALRELKDPLRLHRLPEGTVLDGRWGAEGFLAAARDFFECPEDGLAELTAIVARFAAAPPADVDAAIPATLGSWLPVHVRHPGVRRALLVMATVIFHPRPAEASVGRLMQFFQTPRDGVFIPDDDAVGGMQGLMAPWARTIAACGGEIALGWKPVEIAVVNGRVDGVVALDRASCVRSIRAPAVVSTYPIWENFALVDERLFPPDVVAAAHALRRHRADLVGWTAGLRRLPTIRATGRPDTHAGWNRLVRGPERAYLGGYQITSLSSRRAAPPGAHLLELVIARFFVDDASPAPWPAARADVDDAGAYLRRFYADLDDCVAWQSHRWVPAPGPTSWAWAPVRRHDLTVPGIDGLYLASATVEAPAAIVDLQAWAGQEAAHAIMRTATAGGSRP
jgi:phytoene dehydrogenase-like protein